MLDDEPWEALKKMCEVYEIGWTLYGKSSKTNEPKKKNKKRHVNRMVETIVRNL
jgi:hypothetical protein